jgi:hypothetical protein
MLYAHAASWPVGFAHLVGQVRQVAPTHASAAELLGEFNRPGGIATSQADRVAAGAREDAATSTPAQLGAGLEHTVGLLATMAPTVDFIELATGRSQAAVFPALR